jgi:N-acetylglucosaminyldiphosphoundecaprenol N-acetyl-beta-D-mannosaminyltransferase
MIAPARQSVLGVGISATSYAQVCEYCARWVEQARASSASPSRYICVADVRSIMTARSDSRFRRMLNSSDLTTPDGMPVVWAMRSFGKRAQARVYGPTLMLALCEQAASRGHRVFLYGARHETLQMLRTNLLAKLPKLEIAGMYGPPFRPLTPGEDREVTARIRASGAELLFVGISTPKQEAWMSAHLESLPGVVMLGVGAAFDFHAGRVRQAPGWMQRNGLEWFHRLMMEPRRLWRRYLLQTPLFLPLWFLQFAGLLRFPRVAPERDGVSGGNF